MQFSHFSVIFRIIYVKLEIKQRTKGANSDNEAYTQAKNLLFCLFRRCGIRKVRFLVFLPVDF